MVSQIPLVLFHHALQLVQLAPLPVAPPHKYPDSVSAAEPRSQREPINSSSNTHSGASLQGRGGGTAGSTTADHELGCISSCQRRAPAHTLHRAGKQASPRTQGSPQRPLRGRPYLCGGVWPHGMQPPALPLPRGLRAAPAASNSETSPNTSCPASCSGTETPTRAAAATTARLRQTTARGFTTAAAAPPLATDAGRGGNPQKRAAGTGQCQR